MPRMGFEPTISAGEQPKTYALDRAATGTGNLLCILLQNSPSSVDSPCRADTVDTYGHVSANQSCNR